MKIRYREAHAFLDSIGYTVPDVLDHLDVLLPNVQPVDWGTFHPGVRPATRAELARAAGLDDEPPRLLLVVTLAIDDDDDDEPEELN